VKRRVNVLEAHGSGPEVRSGGASARRFAWAVLAVAGAAVSLPALSGAVAASPTQRVDLEEAIRLALGSDPATVSAATSVSSAQADLLEARGEWLPSLTVSSGYSNSSDERVDQATGRLVSESYNAQITASLELFAGGRRIAGNRAASADLEAAGADYRSQTFQTILRTTEIFYEAAAAADLHRLSEQRLERARQQLTFASTRFDVGTATSSDLLRAELEVGNAELSVLDAESTLRNAALGLGRQIGMAFEVHPASSSLPERAPRLPPRESLVEQAVRSSPAVIAAEAALRGRRADRLAGTSDYLPSATLSGGYDWFSFDFPPDERSWSLRLTASLPIFDGFEREAEVRRATAREQLARATARDASIAVRVEVEAAVGEIESAARGIEIADHAKDLAQEDLRVLEERYQIGATTILELQASQVALTEAEAATVRARQALGMAVARLEAVLGERIEVGALE